MFKKIVSLIVVLSISVILSTSIFAWSYTDYTHGSYVPLIGSGIKNYNTDTNKLETTVKFKFDSYNVAKIKDYNNGGSNPGSACDNDHAYLTLDQTAIPDSWDLEISASKVETNLPNPKIDLENNNFFAEKDESEVTALGTVISSYQYYMKTSWNDYRDGDSGDSGKVQAQFAMSTKGFIDYNNCTQSDAVQHTFTYGNDFGVFSQTSTALATNYLNNFSTNVTSNNYKTVKSNYFDAIGAYRNIGNSKKDVSDYVNTQRRKLGELLLNEKVSDSEVDTSITITFKRALTFKDLNALVSKFNIDIKKLQARSLSPLGERITQASSELIKLDNEEENIFIGYTDLSGYISTKDLLPLSNEESVLLVDISGDNKMTKMDLDEFPIPLTWKIEDLRELGFQQDK